MLQDNQVSVIRQLQKVKADILNTHEELLTWLAARNNNKFKILISDEREITTDPNQLLQSLIQLILNASKYTQDGIITCEITGHGAHQSIAYLIMGRECCKMM